MGVSRMAFAYLLIPGDYGFLVVLAFGRVQMGASECVCVSLSRS